MEVLDSYSYTKDHSIEWGNATWDEQDRSIRNRYDNAQHGGYNYAASAEIPWEDFKTMIHQSIKRNQFSKAELNAIAALISSKTP